MIEMKILVLYKQKTSSGEKKKLFSLVFVYRNSNTRSAISFVHVRLLSTYEYDTWEDNVYLGR